ncbi:salicylate 1-monooxygenase [Cryptococcus amylolentus CBS 6039]|uniref:Salicylate 1-monooxygenase n=2 Tax=Cryptococcus amylolentus TaxID=104669 RepID=A0A1E3HQ37_9TREE|nr:salicylate 1-monooxygenase [Cryptococcus amylolentus CBS 6039]ODN78458.1 salicylate 1-monooxygenase [Cryptococcus amylolentus CBS 6039]ODO06958.1 salicylate 1-monooxygenase [Cryptococcus amylolentus CBS 6273]
MGSQPERNFDIAVVGGGIAGLTLIISLLRSGIKATLYESAHAFGEIGAGVSFGANAVRAMRLIDPRIEEGFNRRVTVNQWESKERTWFDFREGQYKPGKDKGNDSESFATIHADVGQTSVHRAHFLDEMVDLVPEGVAKFHKRLVGAVEHQEDGVTLKFQDGTEAQHSAVIGCDGIKSELRNVILGDDAPTAHAVFSGKYAHRGLIPMEKARELLGDELAQNAQMYTGYHGHVLTFPIEKGDIMNVVAFSSKKKWDDDRWVVHTTKEDMYADFEGWSDHVKSILTLMENPDIWALFNHLPAPTYHKGLMCIIGDAAHATTPHQGSGAGMAIEDSYIMGGLLAEVFDKKDLPAAFQAFDVVRRPRTQKVVTTSYEAGQLYEYELPGVEDDLAKIKDNLEARMAWIWSEDLPRELEIARQHLRRSQ